MKSSRGCKIGLLPFLLALAILWPLPVSGFQLNLTGANKGYLQGACWEVNDAVAPCPNTNNIGWMYVNATHGRVAATMWNMSALPSNASINWVMIKFYRHAGSTNDITDIYYYSNQTWTESEFANYCAGGGYCSRINSVMEDFIVQYNLGSAHNYLNNSAIAAKLNATKPQRFTLIWNISGTTGDYAQMGAENYPINGFDTYMLIDYTEVAGGGGSSGSFTEYTYGQYSFKVSNTTGKIVNITANGESAPVVSDFIMDFWYDNTTKYNISNVTQALIFDTTGYDNLQVNYTLEYGGQSYGLVVTNWHLFNMSNRMYSADTTVYPEYRNTPLWWANASFIANGATKAYYNPSTGEPVAQALTDSGSIYHNLTIDSGSGTALQTAKNFIRGINSSNGFFYVATAHMCENMASSGQNPGCSYSWGHADDLDPDEHLDHMHHDYNITSPTKTMLVKDSGSDSILYYEVRFNSSRNHGYTHILRKQKDVQDLRTVAKDHFRLHFAIGIGSTGDSIVTEMNSFESDVTYLSGEVSFLGNRITDTMGNVQFGVIADAVTTAEYGANPTQSLTTVDMKLGTDTANEMQLALGFRMINDIEKGKGWWLYPPWPVVGYGSSESHFGNAWTNTFTLLPLDTSWLSGYQNTSDELYGRLIDVTTAIALNENTLYGARRNFSITNTKTYIKVNKSLTEVNELFNASRSRTTLGDFRLYFVGSNVADDKYKVHMIKVINLTDYSIIHWDNFTADTSASYSGSVFGGSRSYNATTDSLDIDVGPGNWVRMELAADPDWDDALYIFDIEYVGDFRAANKSSDIGGYVSMFTRYNLTDTDVMLHRIYTDQTSSLTPSGSGSRKSDWVNYDISAGMLSNYWGPHPANSSAYMARYSSAMVVEEAGTGGRIINIQNYVATAATALKRAAQLLEKTARAAQLDSIADSMVFGINWLFEKSTSMCRSDGFCHYSIAYAGEGGGKDDGYGSDTLYQWGLMSRGGNDYDHVIKPLTGLAYYGRYARFNQSESSATSTYYKNVGAVSFISHLSQHRYPCIAGYDPSIANIHYNKLFFFEEYGNNIGVTCSDNADTFGGRSTIYFENNSIKMNWTDAVNVYEHDPNMKLRWGTQTNGKIIDAYQHENSSYAEIVFAMIPNETRSCDYKFDEAYPICTFTGNTHYNRTLFRFANNVDAPYHNATVGNLDIINPAYSPAKVNVKVVDAGALTDYTILVDNISVANFTTDAVEEGNATVEVTSGDLIEIRLASEYPFGGGAPPVPPVTTGSQLIALNITGSPSRNLSKISGYIGVRMISWNLSSAVVSLTENGTKWMTITVYNNTWNSFNITNVSVGVNLYAASFSFNTTSNYTLTVTNTSAVPASPASSPDHLLADNPNAQNVCRKLNTVMIFLGIGMLVAVAVGIMAFMLSGAELNVGLLAIGIFALLVITILGIVFLSAICQV